MRRNNRRNYMTMGITADRKSVKDVVFRRDAEEFVIAGERADGMALTAPQVGVDIRGLALPARLLALLVADLPLGALVAEDLDLAVGTVDGLVAAVVVAVGVDLQVEGQTLHPLLRGEVCAQAVHRDEDLFRERGRERREERERDRRRQREGGKRGTGRGRE